MKIDGEYTFDAPRDAVWEALLDPAVLTTVLPGCEKLEKTGDNAYEGALKIKVGPVQGKFAGKILLEDIEAPTSYTMQVDGRGAPGFVKASANVALEEDGNKTVMKYGSDAQVGGRIASVGQRLLDSSAKAIIKQSLEGLNAALLARMAASAAAAADADGDGADDATGTPVAPVPELPQPPSQAEFARTVAKEVAKDLIPKPVMIVGALVLVAAVLYFVL